MKRLRVAIGLACLLAAAIVNPLRAQTPAPAAQPGAVRMFLDCNSFTCESAFYQTEIAFVTHVRDRSDADVHVLVTPQQTGAGGTQYTIAFLGQGRFAGDTLTLQHTAEPNVSEDAERQALAQVIKLGLVRYVAQSPQGARLQVTYNAPGAAATAQTQRDPWNHWTFELSGEGFFNGEQTYNAPAAAAQAQRDPWNHWTFELSGQGFFDGEQTYSSGNLYGSVSANRVTEQWKLRLSLNASESRNRFDLDSVTEVTSTQTSRSLNGLLVRSLGAHVSAGVTASASRSSFYNQDLVMRVAPAVEYDIYPYAESTRRQFTLRYSVGPTAYRYMEETIFGRMQETRLQQSLIATVVARQPWGSVNVSAEGANYLNNLSQHHLQIRGGVRLNLVRGLSVNVDGQYSRPRDQIYLAAGEADDEEILLRRRQLATGYTYFSFIGFSYTFGSKFSPVVNPRFN